MCTLKFKIQPTVTFSLLSISAADFFEKKCFPQRGQGVKFRSCDWRISVYWVDGSKTRKSLVGFRRSERVHMLL